MALFAALILVKVKMAVVILLCLHSTLVKILCVKQKHEKIATAQ